MSKHTKTVNVRLKLPKDIHAALKSRAALLSIPLANLIVNNLAARVRTMNAATLNK